MSMGCLYRFEWSPCMWNAGSPKSWKFRGLNLSMHHIRVSMVTTTWNFTTGSSKTRRKCPYKPASCNASNVSGLSGLNVHNEWPNVHHVQMILMSKCPWYCPRFHIWLKLSHEVTHLGSKLSHVVTIVTSGHTVSNKKPMFWILTKKSTRCPEMKRSQHIDLLGPLFI